MPRLSDQRLAWMVGLLPEHRTHPEVSLGEHFSHRVTALSRFVLARRRVYLDTRYWIFLRDAAMGRARRPIHSELFELLLREVRAGTLVCPVGDSTFFELLRQLDPETRLATARLIDALSLGVTIQNACDRLQTELVGFLVAVTKEQKIPGPPLERVWLKVGHVLGIAQPLFKGIDAAEQLAITKAFFDVMWSVTLEEQLTDTPLPENAPDAHFEDLAARITVATKAHAADVKEWNDVYLAEINGFFDVHREEICAAFAQLHHLDRPNEQPATAADFQQNERVLVNVLTNIFRFGKAGTGLPTAQIVAGVHAIVRWHQQRPFAAHDFFDMYHATAALPYCDLFLTERFLGTALTRPPLDMAKHFGTTVVWEEESALAAIQALRGRSPRPVSDRRTTS